LAELAQTRDTLLVTLPRGTTTSRPIAPLWARGDDATSPTTCRERRPGVKGVQVVGQATRTVRLYLAGELDRLRDFVDPLREQMDAGMTRIIVNIDDLSMDGQIGLVALRDIRALRAECGAVIIWSRDPLECFRMPVA
jgi:hypothetical protein